jgi:hypothetical protein
LFTAFKPLDFILGARFKSYPGNQAGLEPLEMNPTDPFVNTFGERLGYPDEGTGFLTENRHPLLPVIASGATLQP